MIQLPIPSPDDDVQDEILNILEECERAGNPDMVYMFASTPCRLRHLFRRRERWCDTDIGVRRVFPIRVCCTGVSQNQIDGLKAHMKKHSDLLRPKFEAVLNILEEELAGLGSARTRFL